MRATRVSRECPITMGARTLAPATEWQPLDAIWRGFNRESVLPGASSSKPGMRWAFRAITRLLRPCRVKSNVKQSIAVKQNDNPRNSGGGIHTQSTWR